jgi:hypothetical protein
VTPEYEHAIEVMADFVAGALENWTDEAREVFISRLLSQYCCSCGSSAGDQCNCMRDDYDR